jgi:hypothetical protein
MGTVWLGCRLFTLGYLHLTVWKGLLAFVVMSSPDQPLHLTRDLNVSSSDCSLKMPIGPELQDDVKVPATALKAVRQYRQLRNRIVAEKQRAATAGRIAAKILRRGELKLSMRDAAEMLGVSHQRVHQLTRPTEIDGRKRQRK